MVIEMVDETELLLAGYLVQQKAGSKAVAMVISMAVLMVAWRDVAWVDWRVEQSDRRMENRLVVVKVDWTDMPMAE